MQGMAARPTRRRYGGNAGCATKESDGDMAGAAMEQGTVYAAQGGHMEKDMAARPTSSHHGVVEGDPQ